MVDAETPVLAFLPAALGRTVFALRGTAGTYNRHEYAEEKLAAAEALARRVRAIVAPDDEPSEGEPDNVLRPEFPRRGAGSRRS